MGAPAPAPLAASSPRGADRPRHGPLKSLLLALLLGVLAGGCRLQLDVNIDVAKDGSGVVEVAVGLDPDALAKIGGDLRAVMDVGDLVDAGWVVDGPTAESDGFTRVRIRHAFATPAEAATVIGQIAGQDGPFQQFHITRHQSFADTTWRFAGKVDFTRGLGAAASRRLPAQVDGQPLGRSTEELEKQLGASLSRLIQVRVRTRLPGHVTSNATTKADNGAVWQVGFGETTAVDLSATGHERRTSAVIVVGVGSVVALAALVLLLVRLADRFTNRP